MSDELLPYYNRELEFLRKIGADYAEAHPKIAERLKISADGYQDPHVERMVEAFAFLAARIRHKLDDDFPELTDALLSVLYPHYQAPLPSVAMVQVALDRSLADSPGYSVQRGSLVETEAEGGAVRFRTCYPVTAYPMEVSAASLGPLPFVRSTTPLPPRTVAALRVELKCFSRDMTLSKMRLPYLRFYLRGQEEVMGLYELIFNNTVEVALLTGGDNPPIFLGKEAVRPVGFERDEALLPYTRRSFPGYALISEYFAFPRKFLFFDVVLKPEVLAKLGNKVELCLYMNKSSTDLERQTSPETFKLGCTPIVNLFPHRAEPIELTQAQTEYRVTPDARRPLGYEVYAVEKVTATSPDGEKKEYQPFYSVKHVIDRAKQQIFWYATRRQARVSAAVDPGTEVYVNLVDLAFTPTSASNWVIDVQATCLNRDLPRRLPFGGGQPHMHLADGGPVKIECLTQPTPTLRPPRRHAAMWRLISNLSLNHLSVSGGADGADALREVLKMYDFADSAETRAKVESIQAVTSKRVVGRAGGATAGGFCRGLEVAIKFDETRFSDNGLFLFAAVIERFLGLYCSINSFSQLVALSTKREGEMKRWPPRASEKVLL